MRSGQSFRLICLFDYGNNNDLFIYHGIPNKGLLETICVFKSRKKSASKYFFNVLNIRVKLSDELNIKITGQGCHEKSFWGRI